MPELKNLRQEKFALAVAEGKPQSIAYREAGYKVQGGDENEQAAASASRLASNARVKARIQELKNSAVAAAVEQLQITTTDVLRLLWDAATFDPRAVLAWKRNKQGKLQVKVRDIDDIPISARRQIKSIRTVGEDIVVAFHDPRPAVRLVGEHLGLWQGEAAGAQTIVDNSQHVTFVDTARHESPEEWQARVQKRLAEASKVVNGEG